MRVGSSRGGGRLAWGFALALLCLSPSGCVPAPGEKLPDLDAYRARLAAISTRELPQTSWILDRNGTLLAELVPEEGYRTWIPLDEIPVALQHAVVATEDRSFYENPGIDSRAVARAAIQNSSAGDTVSGASTITMQLVRLVAFGPSERFEVSMERKLREVYLAAEVDETFSKAQILEAYLNAAYFGNRAQGVEAAAERYFGRHARELSVAECTMLAGLVQAPSALDPRGNPQGARARQRTVLDSMVDAGYLQRSEAEIIWMTPLGLVDPPEQRSRQARYFVDYVLQSALPAALGPEIAARGGFTVTTSLDLDYDQRLAVIAADHVSRLRAAHDLTAAAVVAMRPGSGEILAMVGGVDYDDPVDGQVNMTTSPRQLGSTFKPVAYGAFIEAGGSPASLLWDIPWRFQRGAEVYQPVNYDGRYRGPVRLREALANSMNAAAVDVAAQLGVETLHAKARAMGLPLDPRPSQYGLSLVLGGGAVPLLDMVGVYAALANGGRHAAPTAILSIVDAASGGTIYRHETESRRVLDARAAWLVTDILSDAEARRPAFGAAPDLRLSRPAAVKTGTSNDFRDNTTIGYTPYLAVGVWTGNRDNRPMRNVLGITGAAPIWKAAMEAAIADPELMLDLGSGQPPVDGFEKPPGIEQVQVCRLDSLGSGGSCASVGEWVDASRYRPDPEAVFGQFQLSGSGAARCSLEAGGSGGRPLLRVDRSSDMAATVRDWAAKHGVAVAPPLCLGVQ
ncbi:MAG: transglycosylase domain-containing protein [Caldilineae bacterium]|nr:transglycosylase domain-containing protein [Caldilineae bacterium]